MNRRETVLAMLALGMSPAMAWAQGTAKVRRIAAFGLADVASWVDADSPFLQALRDLGWTENQNLAVERRFALSPERLPALLDDLARSKVEVIVVNTAGLAKIAHNATKSIPIVALAAGDLEGTGLISSLARPGGNVTGMQILAPDLMSKRIELLKQLLPGLSRLAVLEPITPTGIITANYLRVITDTAEAAGVKVQRVQVRGIPEIEAALAGAVQRRNQALLVIANPLSMAGRKEIADAALKVRLPAMYESRPFVGAGGLISFGAVSAAVHRRAATFVDRILRGEKPENLPVEQPTEFEMVVNLKTAQAMGIAVPKGLIVRADEVID